MRVLNKKELGLRIARELYRQNITQAELAEKIDVLPNDVSRWVAGKHSPSLDAAVRIADVLGVTIDELVGRV